MYYTVGLRADVIVNDLIGVGTRTNKRIKRIYWVRERTNLLFFFLIQSNSALTIVHLKKTHDCIIGTSTSPKYQEVCPLYHLQPLKIT